MWDFYLECKMKSYITDANNRILFSKDMTIAELIDASCELLTLFQRLDVQLPFGDRSVEELCGYYGISSENFLLLCRIYAGEEFEPDVNGMSKQDLTHILRYLRASHLYYLEEALPSIEQGVERVLEECDAKQSLIVRRFFDGYADEVRAHLEFEESVIFPYVEQVLQGVKGDVSIAQSMEGHTDICDKVDDIKSIIIKYLPESCSTKMRSGLIMDLFRLHEDLARHTLIEVRVLTPLVVEVEKSLGL